MDRWGKRWTIALVAAGLFVAGGLGSGAQKATPRAADHAHPAHIHLGDCQHLDPHPTFMLSNVTAPEPVSAPTGGIAAIPVEQSNTVVDVSLGDLRTGGYAINIHQSAEQIGAYIACGNLTSADGGNTLVVGLGELNGSGYSGIAVLNASDNQTAVNVYLTEGLVAAAAGAAGSPAADTADAAAAVTTVGIKNLAFNPAAIEIPVGGSVTWTNQDAVPHSATARDRTLLQSGTLNPGESFTHTFAAAGEFDYFCEFHANMKGSIVVR